MHGQHNNAAPETMLYNLTKTINWKDILYINYAEGACNNHKFKSLSERFCDNIMLYYMVPLNKDVKVNKVEYLSKFLVEYTLKIKILSAEHTINVNKRYIRPTYVVAWLLVQDVNDEGSNLQKEVQEAKQLHMQLCN